MPEISESAALLIAMSFHSLQNADQHSQEIFYSSATFCIITAVFFIEESLTTIIWKKGWATELIDKFSETPSLYQKMKFFWGKFPTRFNPLPRNKNRKKEMEIVLARFDSEFHGFSDLYHFRNAVCHGDLMKTRSSKKVSIPNVDKLLEMRQNAKNIVDKLLETSALTDQRIVNFWEAAKSISENIDE